MLIMFALYFFNTAVNYVVFVFRSGCYLTVLYILIKLLYVVNIVAQLFILSAVLHPQYTYYGIEVKVLPHIF